MAPVILSNLDPDQQGAVKKTDGANLILAGAGSGKTRVLTYKVAYLILEKKVPGENILMVTFTNKAANEMKERVNRFLESKSTLPFMGTFHSFCAKILRVEAEKIGRSRGFSIYDDADQLDLVKEVISELSLSTQNIKPQSILSAISSSKAELVTPLEYQKIAYSFFGQTVSKVYPKYQELLEKNNALDFDDLILETVNLLKKDGEVRKKYQEKYHYILVDEYQDVNTSQYELTKILAAKWKNITVVGDASQAIYGFRGADFRNILNFEKDWPSSSTFNLTQNYRSTQPILDAAYSIISQNESHPILKLWTKEKDGEPIQIFEAANEIDESFFVLEEILGSKLPLSSFAILYRTNAQSRVLEEACLRMGIPYILVGGIRFYQRKEIKDVLSYLRLVANPKDQVSKKRAEKLGKGRFLKFEKTKSEIKPKDKPTDIIEKILKGTGYLLFVDDGTEKGKMRVENVKELLSVAQKYENLDDFLENISLVELETQDQYVEEGNQKNEAVTLMTVHSAKGLEFDTVFLVGMEEGLFPHSRSSFDPTQLEEERRLAYVGATRAKKKLYLTYAQNRLFLGRRSTSVVSRFLLDIPDDLILKAGK